MSNKIITQPRSRPNECRLPTITTAAGYRIQPDPRQTQPLPDPSEQPGTLTRATSMHWNGHHYGLGPHHKLRFRRWTGLSERDITTTSLIGVKPRRRLYNLLNQVRIANFKRDHIGLSLKILHIFTYGKNSIQFLFKCVFTYVHYQLYRKIFVIYVKLSLLVKCFMHTWPS